MLRLVGKKVVRVLTSLALTETGDIQMNQKTRLTRLTFLMICLLWNRICSARESLLIDLRLL
jgi:hypothetical protein